MFEAARALIQIVKVTSKLILGAELSATDAEALDPHIPVSIITTAAAETRTLKNGSPGAIKILYCKTYVDDAVITPTNLANGTAITLNAAGDCWIGYMFRNEWVTIHLTATAAVA
jgi:hypothetical protein